MVGSAVGRLANSGSAPNALVVEAINFVQSQLSKWRNHPMRPVVTAEEEINAQLCKYLNDRARHEFPMAQFHHEERQFGRSRVDFSAVPSSGAITAFPYLGTIYEPFLVFEGKRLPAPAVARRCEYVTGLALRTGGIQRFRLGLHGGAHEKAVMVGYLQEKDSAHWFQEINLMIDSLANDNSDTTCDWAASDILSGLTAEDDGVARCESQHNRGGQADDIQIVHLWVRMTLPQPNSTQA